MKLDDDVVLLTG